MKDQTDIVEGGWVKNPIPLPAWTTVVEPSEPETFDNTVREKISESLLENNETWKDVEHSTLSDNELDQGFDECIPVECFVWTKNRVYFVEYCCIAYIISAPRNPLFS